MVLRGEARIGKTRLANSFLAWARTQGAEVLQGGAFESGSHMPFQPLVEALRTGLERHNVLQVWPREAWLSPLTLSCPGRLHLHWAAEFIQDFRCQAYSRKFSSRCHALLYRLETPLVVA